jgi:hypothetical protein
VTRGAIALLMAGALGCSRGGESRCAKFRAEPVRSLGNPEPSAVGGNTTAAGSAPVPSFRGPELLAPLGAIGYANPGPPGLSQHRSAASRLRVCAKFRAEPVRSLGNPEPSAVGGNTTAAGSAPVPSFRGPELLAPLGAVGYANPGPPGLSQHRSAASRLRVCAKFRAEVAAELELEAREAIEAAIAEVRPGQQYLAAEEMMS